MKVAAIIPVRNRPIVVERAIRSIQSQTYSVAEIIIVDDGSTDNTVEVIDRLAREDCRITMLKQNVRKGAGAARNLGVSSTDCEIIAFLDSDDEWLPQKIEIQINLLKSEAGAMASFTGQYLIDGERRTEVNLPKSLDLEELMKSNVLSTTSSAAIRRSAFLSVGGFDENLPSCQDWDLWLRLRSLGDFCIVSDPLVLFYQGNSDRISKNPNAVLEGHKIVFSRIINMQNKKITRRSLKSAHYLRMSQIFFSDIPRYVSSIYYGILSFFYKPNIKSLRSIKWATIRMINKRR